MSVERMTIYAVTPFSDIPSKPDETGIWMIDARTALWFTTFDDKWRFLRMEMDQRTQRSVEEFESKHQAMLFHSDNALTWTRVPLTKKGDNK